MPSPAIMRSAASSSAAAVFSSCSRRRPTLDSITQRRYVTTLQNDDGQTTVEVAMSTATDQVTGLAYELEGAGTPVVFLHGLTFDRRSWRPIIERLGGSVRSIAIDLPAHGESGGAPGPFDAIAAQLHELLGSLAVDRPIVVGHSMSGGLASFYATTYPTCGL